MIKRQATVHFEESPKLLAKQESGLPLKSKAVSGSALKNSSTTKRLTESEKKTDRKEKDRKFGHGLYSIGTPKKDSITSPRNEEQKANKKTKPDTDAAAERQDSVNLSDIDKNESKDKDKKNTKTPTSAK